MMKNRNMTYRSNNIEVAGIVIMLMWFALWAAVIVGWVMNVIKIVGLLNTDITPMFVARAVGVFAVPLGAVLGYL